MGKEAGHAVLKQPVEIALRKAAMADSSVNTPQRPGWNTANVGPAVEHATIGSSIVIKGEVSGSEALFVDGSVEGSINIPGHRVTVGRNSTVKADIAAKEVVVMGTVKGNIHCADLLDIRAESHLQGQIVTQRIRIDDGAVLRGSVEIQRAEKSAPVISKPVAVEAQKPEAPAVTAKSEAASSVATEPVMEQAKQAPPTAPSTVPDAATEKTEGDTKALAAAVARRMSGSGGWFKSGR
jgi:cytoskeletal protein CcmA (bactofilin family)